MTVLLIMPSTAIADINDELIEAATEGDFAKIKNSIEHGADVNARSVAARGGVANTTALMRAAYQGHIAIIKLLIESGADVNAKDNDGRSALMWAVYGNNMSIAKLLIEKGADVKNGEGWAILQEVVSGPRVFFSEGLGGHQVKEVLEAEKIELVKLLINNGADVNWYKSGDTPLSGALLSGKTEMAKILLNGGADPNIQISNGQTPLMFAIANNDTEMIKLLIDKKADVNLKSADDSTALMIAAGRGHVGIADALIKKGADINVKNKNGDTALSLAKINGHTGMIKLLKQAGTVEPKEEALISSAKEQKTSRPILYFDVDDKEGTPSAVTKGVYPDGRSLRLLVRGTGAVWSPDGAWFANVTEENSLIIRNLQGEVRNIFTPGKEHLLSHSIWSPDGKRIAVISIVPGNAAENVVSVVIIDVAGGKVLSRHGVPSWAVTPSKFRWSPNGRKILLVNGISFVGGAVVIDTETGATETLTDKFIIAEWAPDSDSVYYFEINVIVEQELVGFYLKKLGDSKPVKLMDKEKVDSLGLKTWVQINLSPESTMLLVVGGILTSAGVPKNEFKEFIYIYDVSDGKTVVLNTPYKKFQVEDLITSLEWSPDGNSLAALVLDASQMTTAKIKIMDLLKGKWKTVATLNTVKISGTDLIDMLYLGKTLSWTK